MESTPNFTVLDVLANLEHALNNHLADKFLVCPIARRQLQDKEDIGVVVFDSLDADTPSESGEYPWFHCARCRWY